ncbi:S1C family serine protease [Isoptericola sp. 178]|uniref:S1C family serine protease n=1 Tax=Isoptericola sp. 178 TaxID=3064651 RepID=UPI002712BBF0|nr:trypsin-like peptidase domain-containing protein [Isoptericola sp. 178]MDO8144331.1 trypsin-like peptidase domain-containing protein [Isoptericola sp. 178]
MTSPDHDLFATPEPPARRPDPAPTPAARVPRPAEDAGADRPEERPAGEHVEHDAGPTAPQAPVAPTTAPTAPPPHAAHRRRPVSLGAGRTALVVVLALVVGLLGGLLGGRITDRAGEDAPVSADLPVSAGVQDDGADDSRPAGSHAAIAAGVLPSVVSLEITRSGGGGSSGSGFVLREDGYILTNDHVVAPGAGGGGDVVVVLADGSEHDGEIVGRTSDYDLAVVKIDVDGLTPLVLGDSDDVVVGDAVLAVGAPLGLDSTVTAGIVSALHRPVQAGDQATTAFIDAIQTDAAINPGNSGGPLVDADGEVVGINSAIAQPPGATQATGSIGLGFAIPANQARTTAEQLIETGQATYPVIGVLLDTSYSGEGVQVSTEAQEGIPPVTPDGPADVAGVRAGDVILAIDDRPVSRSDELIVAIRARQPGDAVTLRVRSDGEEREVRVVLQERASE